MALCIKLNIIAARLSIAKFSEIRGLSNGYTGSLPYPQLRVGID